MMLILRLSFTGFLSSHCCFHSSLFPPPAARLLSSWQVSKTRAFFRYHNNIRYALSTFRKRRTKCDWRGDISKNYMEAFCCVWIQNEELLRSYEKLCVISKARIQTIKLVIYFRTGCDLSRRARVRRRGKFEIPDIRAPPSTEMLFEIA